MFSFAMSSGLASDSDKFKIIIMLCRAQKFGKYGTLQKFRFFVQLTTAWLISNFSRNLVSFKKDVMS